MEVALAVLAATSTTSIVFFPVTFFYGVSKYLFTDLALGVVLSIFASYIFAMTVVPLYCAQFIRIEPRSTRTWQKVKRHRGPWAKGMAAKDCSAAFNEAYFSACLISTKST